MEELELLLDLHKGNVRQGPGSRESTRMAYMLAGLGNQNNPKIADIGCGTGVSSLQLAAELDCQITAVDFLKSFLDRLKSNAETAGVSNKIETIEASMDELPFSENQFDVIWSEGAIYNIGFEKGIREWKRFLKPGGFLCISEITWLTDTRPDEIEKYWGSEYPEINTASAKIKQLEENGYILKGYFPLSKECWLENYYIPLENGYDAFLKRHKDNETAAEIIAAEKKEVALYKKYSDYYSYGFYIAQKA